MKKILLTFIILVQTALWANSDPLYEIRGDSALLDANLTRFLHQWREETTCPIAEGNYTNIYLHGDTTQGKKIALTFDDSPDENNTGKVLDILKHYDVKASFFMIAAPMLDVNATITKRVADEGHLVLNHSFNHPHFTHISDEEIAQEIQSSSERIATITGHYPLLFRPPYGSVNQRVVDTLNAQGCKSILWSLDSLDWAMKDKNAIIENIMTHVQPGDIILMHSSRANNATVEALGEIIEKLRNQGYQFQRVDEMLGIKAYR
ncbi:polysaccharide deacetylase family protein [Sulfuricurvum sp.]|uniref:polysaccharide deacetylase family protein n=1 Tax=Sulfuricurvum sp. TaxID=2025608 RepID=UPI003BB06E37